MEIGIFSTTSIHNFCHLLFRMKLASRKLLMCGTRLRAFKLPRCKAAAGISFTSQGWRTTASQDHKNILTVDVTHAYPTLRVNAAPLARSVYRTLANAGTVSLAR